MLHMLTVIFYMYHGCSKSVSKHLPKG